MAAQVLEQAWFLPSESPRDPRWDRLRLGLLGGWLVLFAGVLLLGEHVVPVSQLDAVVSSGATSTVSVSSPVPAAWRPSSRVQTAHWTVGIHRYVASVRRRDPRAGQRTPAVARPAVGVVLVHEPVRPADPAHPDCP